MVEIKYCEDSFTLKISNEAKTVFDFVFLFFIHMILLDSAVKQALVGGKL